MTTPASVRRITGWLCVLFAVVLAFLGAEVVAYSRNSLVNHLDWVSGKGFPTYAPMGAGRATQTRNLVQRNRLNLQEWFGFNEVLVNRVFAFGGVDLSFRLVDDAYVAVLFNKTAASFCGIRLSRRADLPSIFFRADGDGRFLEKQPLGELGLDAGWHQVALRARGAGVQLELDGRVLDQLPVEPLAMQLVGVRGGSLEALVDDVVVTDARGEILVDEDFRNDHRLWPLRVTLFLGALGLFAWLLRFARSRRVDEKQFLFRFILGVHLLVLTLVLYLCVDFFFWSSRYPYRSYTPWQRGYRLSTLEFARRAVFAPFALFDIRESDGSRVLPRGPSYARVKRFLNVAHLQPALRVQVFRTGATAEPFSRLLYNKQAVREYLDTQPLGAAFTILFLGTSQTRGTGATHVEKSMVSQIHARLASRTTRPLASFNGAVSGSNSQELLRLFGDELTLLSPDLVVVNLSNNDAAATFADGLRALVRMSRERGARVLFVLEANSLEYDPPHLLRQHKTKREVAAEAGVPVVPLYDHTARHEREDAGFLWWDKVHLTSFGQSVAAEAIAEGILEHFGAMLVEGDR